MEDVVSSVVVDRIADSLRAKDIHTSDNERVS